MKRNTKRFLTLFLALTMAVMPVTSLRAQDVAEYCDETVVEGDMTQAEPTVEEKKEEKPVEEEQKQDAEDGESKPAEEESEPEVSTGPETEGILAEEEVELPGQEMEEKPNVQIPSGDVGIRVLKTSDNEEFGMFKISKSSASVNGDQIIISAYSLNKSYSYLYLGSVSEATLDRAIEGVNTEDGGWVFNFSVPVSKAGENIPIALYNPSKQDWYMNAAYSLVLHIPEGLVKGGEDNPSEQIPEGEDTEQTLEFGKYSVPNVTTSSGMFNVTACTVKQLNDSTTVLLTLGGTGYDYLYYGTAEEMKNADTKKWISYTVDADGKYVFSLNIPQDEFKLDSPIHIAARGARINANGDHSFNDRTITLSSEGVGTVQSSTLDDGKYNNVQVDVNTSMVNVADCVITSIDGKMTAAITFSTKSTGYDYLFMGTKEEAEKATEWIAPSSEYLLNGVTYRTFNIPISSLDQGMTIATRGARIESDGTHKWYTRTFIFNSESMKKVEGDSPSTPGNNTGNTGNTGTKPTTPTVDTTPDSESKYESDLSRSTGKVNNTTKLKDGVYTPDRFMWSGGTGRVSISCSKVTITNGQAYATIVFSSGKYNYVKANGNKYYASHAGDTSSFTIPIELNKNNQIIGMTTAMSAAHEVTYSIFVYLAAAAEADGKTVSGIGLGSSKTLDEEAPDILGLEYEEEVTLDYAKYFKIYKYEKGITLLEVDMMSDTAREDMDEASEEGSDASGVQTQEDIAAELYRENIVKYLIVPDGEEIPAGLDKEVIVIEQPADKAYAAADGILEQMEQIDALEQIAAVACEEEDCKIDSIAEAMKDEKVVYAGTFDEIDYKSLISSKCNFAILPDDVLPQEDNEKDAKEADKLTVKEQEEQLNAITEKLALLGIPVVVDRSLDEEEDLAQQEWIKVYGVLFGCEDKAAEIFANGD